MNFFKQIIAETKNMMRSKFLLISGIVMFLIACVVIPIFSYVMNQKLESGTFYGNNGSITVDGVEYSLDNTLAWDLDSYMYTKQYLTEYTNDQQVQQYADEILEMFIDFNTEYIQYVDGYDDYRMDTYYGMRDLLITLYVLDHQDADLQKLLDAIMFVYYDSIGIEAMLEKSDAEKTELKTVAENALSLFDELMKSNEFSAYVDLKKAEYAVQIDDYNSTIEMLEKSLIDDPTQEEYVSEQIESLQRDIDSINNEKIPTLEYRLENNILPNDGSWQDLALLDIDSSTNSIYYLEKDLKTEEEFKDTSYLISQYGTYEKYLDSIEIEKKEAELNLIIAQSSLDSGKPDMKFVSTGARNQTHSTLSLTVLVSIFAMLVGGCAVATDFQNGTVRLLMIRPRTRMKILFSKFFAGLIIIVSLYFVIFLVSFLTNGFMCGFADYLYPNYTAGGEINYFFTLICHIWASTVGLIFLYSLSFAMSTVTRNVAVSIIIPTVALMGSTVAVGILSSMPVMQWLAFTPFPYLSMQDFYTNYSSLQALIEKGFMASVGLGIGMLFVYAGVLMTLALTLFKKKDITN